jgi:hypothetical protein
MDSKVCKSILHKGAQPQPLSNFHKFKPSPDGHYDICRDCVRERDANKYASSQEAPCKKSPKKVDEDTVKKIRLLFSQGSIPIRQLCDLFGFNVRSIIYNKSHFDPNYNPPHKQCGKRRGS